MNRKQPVEFLARQRLIGWLKFNARNCTALQARAYGWGHPGLLSAREAASQQKHERPQSHVFPHVFQ